jgi:hypothetical protein
MKKIFFYCLLFIFLLKGNTIAQKSNINKLLTTLNGLEIFQKCIIFKKEVSEKITSLKSKQNIYPDKFNQLRVTYTELYEVYDAFLKTVKTDLSNTENLKSLINNPEAAAENYAAAYLKVKETYEGNFLPLYNTIQYTEAKGLPITVLIKFGIDAFKIIVNSIKNHRLDKDAALNLMLPLVNEKLFNKLKLNTWSQFNLPTPLGYKTQEAIVIPERTINTLQGKIDFFQKNNETLIDQLVSFDAGEGKKDINVISENSNETKSSSDEYFVTRENYSVGEKFRLEVNNTGFTYILVLNSNGVVLLYPNQNLKKIEKDGEKDFTLSYDETPKVGLVNIPEYNLKGVPRYFEITKSVNGVEVAAEEIAILLSKSELELVEIVEKLNSIVGNLSERVTSVFGIKKISLQEGNIIMHENSISFNADDTEKNILPIVFKILKK